MSDSGAPRLLDSVLRRLFPGSLGDEARREMNRQYRSVRARRGRLVAVVWYLGHLVHPHTWALAMALRRRQRTAAHPAAGASFVGWSISWLDVRLGIRMMVRYPVMTAVSGLAITVTIAVAVATFALFRDFLLRPELPLPEPDRVVSLGLKDMRTLRTERRLLHEAAVWREALESVEHIGLWREQDRVLVGSDGTGEVVRAAVMSSSGFDVARVPPLIGRPLRPEDEVAGSPRVVVIGHEPWTRRFDADPEIIGRRILLDGEPHTVVGVMPEGFGFPYAERFWLPIQDDPDDWPLLQGPGGYHAFGRLASGVTMARANAELRAVTARRAAELTETHAGLAARVMPYSDAYTGMGFEGAWLISLHRLILGLITLLVLIPFANVAILVYARTASRIGEMAVRSGLGASRGRIVLQLFVEALVVALPASLLGIGVALLALAHIDTMGDLFFGGGMPFWARSGREPWTIVYASGLAVFAAALAAVIPGLQATGPRAHDHLKATGRHMRLGRVWTGLVIVQVAITVAGLPLAGWTAWGAMGIGMTRPTFAAGDYVSVRVATRPQSTPAPGAGGARTTAVGQVAEVVRRVESLPGVTGAHSSDRLPTGVISVGFWNPDWLEIDGIGPAGDAIIVGAPAMAVDAGFFEFLGVRILDGREFLPGDARAAAPPVLVSRAFAERTFRGANPIGRSVREYRPAGEQPAAWREVVGVVDDLLENPIRPEQRALPHRQHLDVANDMIFVPLDPAAATTAYVTVRAPGMPPALVTDISRVVAAVDPSIRLDPISPLSEPRDPVRTLMAGIAAVIAVVLSSILFLATAGVFSLISFNVTRRRREIGIRSALGARPRQVLLGVMARSIRQLAAGVTAGALIVALVPPLSVQGQVIHRDPRLLALVAGVLVVMGVVAAWAPARAALSVQPVDALRAD